MGCGNINSFDLKTSSKGLVAKRKWCEKCKNQYVCTRRGCVDKETNEKRRGAPQINEGISRCKCCGSSELPKCGRSRGAWIDDLKKDLGVLLQTANKRHLQRDDFTNVMWSA